MCRIMFLKWQNTKKAQEYIDALFLAGENDPLLENIVKEFSIPKLWNKHIHGWGYILLDSHGIHHYANADFFLEDISGKNQLYTALENARWEFVLMIELRVTDEWYVSAFNTHPFHFISQNGYEWYLFYNGLLDYKKLAEIEHIDFSNYHTKNGTTIMGMSIAKALEAWNTIKEAIERPKKALKSSYNLMLFYRNNLWKYVAHIHAFISEHLLTNSIVFEHNKLIKKYEDDIIFIGSSAIELYKPWNYSVLGNGENIEFDIDFLTEYYFDGYN